MTFTRALFKRCMQAAILSLSIMAPALAADFQIKRGLNLDIWVVWPMEDQWHDENVLLPFPEWRQHLDAEKLARLKRDGFDFLRMPVDPAPFLSAQSAHLHDRLYESVRDSVRMINEAGLKVIVDLHSINRSDNPAIGMSGIMADPAKFDQYVDLTRRMAQTLKQEDPAQVALELMNEPATSCDPAGIAKWAEQLQRLYAAARSSATRLSLVLSGGCDGNANGLLSTNPNLIPDQNILWSFHSYQPFLLTHQGARWAGDFIRYVSGLTYPPDRFSLDNLIRIKARIKAEAPVLRRAGMIAYLDESFAELDTPEKLAAELSRPFDQVAGWASANGIAPERILLGEFGMIRQEYGSEAIMPAQSRAAYVGDMITKAEEHGFAWAIWGYGGAFGVVEAFDGQSAEPNILNVVRGLN